MHSGASVYPARHRGVVGTVVQGVVEVRRLTQAWGGSWTNPATLGAADRGPWYRTVYSYRGQAAVGSVFGKQARPLLV